MSHKLPRNDAKAPVRWRNARHRRLQQTTLGDDFAVWAGAIIGIVIGGALFVQFLLPHMLDLL
jgi:hypothetical protein